MEQLTKFFGEWTWIITVSGIITALGIIWTKALYPFIKFIKKTNKIIEELEIAYPVLENFVNSYSKDGKCTLDDKFKEIAIDMWLRRERHRIYMELDDAAVFELDSKGNVQWVSEQWMELFDQNFVEASGYGWLAGVNSNDRDKVTHEWELAMLHKRQFKMKFRIKENGKTTLIHCTILPVKDEYNKVYCYIGKIKLVDKQLDLGA